MAEFSPSRRFSVRGSSTLAALAFAWMVTPLPMLAQVHGVPPSVTSIQFHVPPFLPNALPSVTSLGPYGGGYRAGALPPPYGVHPRPRSSYGYGNRGPNRYNTGAYIAPYYFEAYDPGYGYDSAGTGPYLYSGPSEQTVHIVVDLPPRRSVPDDYEEAEAPDAVPPPKQIADARPLDATVLVFRDGRQQQVTNYAIMGQTLYVYGAHTQKIGLSDLDIPATIKLNDESGVEFHLPDPKQS